MSRPILLPGDRPLLHLALLGATLLTTSATYLFTLSRDFNDLTGPVLFSLSVVAILGSHEMGHYVVARLHGVPASLPYFIPVPLLGFGTLGAVIDIRGRIPHRNALADIGAAGPIAGVVVALPILVWGLAHSRLGTAPRLEDTFPTEQSLVQVVQTLIEYLGQRLDGTWEPTSTWLHLYQFEDSLLMRGLKHLVVGEIPEGRYVVLHPMALAGWFGLLVTLLNVSPIGSLDGGHVSWALFGDAARWIGRGWAAVLLFLALFYSVGWTMWLLFAVKLVGFGHPGVEHPEVPLTRGRKVTGAICYVLLVLCFTPVPVRVVPW